jgi:lipopolysaccharide transport system ATP-binding protein
MSKPVIRVEHLSKSYQIGQLPSYKTLRDTLASAGKLPIQMFRSLMQKNAKGRSNETTIWSLKDVSFEVRKGDVVGIIGRNGAGKSTLLKILSKITLPTEGRIERYGRLGSLLEVGTGFHPELTGRENIYLNGAILGMKKTEIVRKFDEIVAFSEIEKFLDTAVKHYSSGMYVRLAFAVAAHLEPDILIVDEVLAVGDIAFQKKCLGKMGQVAYEGRTILFVSHNMASLQVLCNRGILIQNGVLIQDSTMDTVINTYLKLIGTTSTQGLNSNIARSGVGAVKLEQVEIYTDSLDSPNTLMTGKPAQFVFHLTRLLPKLTCLFTIYNQSGQPVAHLSSAINSREDFHDATLGTKIICRIDELSLVPGSYRINVALSTDEHLQDHIEGAAIFVVEQGVFQGRPISADTGYGNALLPHHWVTPWEI